MSPVRVVREVTTFIARISKEKTISYHTNSCSGREGALTFLCHEGDRYTYGSGGGVFCGQTGSGGAGKRVEVMENGDCLLEFVEAGRGWMDEGVWEVILRRVRTSGTELRSGHGAVTKASE